jgi:hypothetical protein
MNEMISCRRVVDMPHYSVREKSQAPSSVTEAFVIFKDDQLKYTISKKAQEMQKITNANGGLEGS